MKKEKYLIIAFTIFFMLLLYVIISQENKIKRLKYQNKVYETELRKTQTQLEYCANYQRAKHVKKCN